MRLAIVLAFISAIFSLKLRGADLRLTDANPMEMPAVGSYGLRILSPTILELTLISLKAPDPARVTQWDFVTSDFQGNLPSAQEFSVTVAGQTVLARNVGFRRRPIYAPLNQRDLRIGNHLYLELGVPMAEGQSVEVKNPSGSLWSADMQFACTATPVRFNPAIHVNQVGYSPVSPKKAMVGYYLGSLGELKVPTDQGFNLIDAATGAIVYHGSFTQRLDAGFSYTPAPYQQVWQADFSDFTTPGEYRLAVPGMGASYAFRIDEGTAAAFARSFALGLFHQRCGFEETFPFTRFTHGACHTAMADIPTMAFTTTQGFLASKTSDTADYPRQTAPPLKDVNSSLYPFVNQGKIDVSGGHHDAGDYSKYTINSSGLIHFLVFAADSFAGVGALDNLGIPESGDGKSDLLQEAKWEADYLAKMQDADGGFYFLVYPRDREYENDVLPDHGDPQVVWPKTTSVTAAATAALAEIASSPLFKQQFPVEAALYLKKAQLGWTFLQNAIAKYGKDGSYQKITHYGNEFMHDDELAWAASAMYVATGDPAYQAKLIEWYDPSDPNTRRWTWWRLFEGYGCAARTYAFAARSGRLSAAQLDPAYLAKCQQEIMAAAQDQVHFAQESAYGTSFPDLDKAQRNAGWYFSSERAFDVTVAYQLDPRPEFKETVVGNFNYEGGCNPVNMTYITGLGAARQREIVHQYAQNDHAVLPPSGFPLGNVQSGFAWVSTLYNLELGGLSFPPDGAVSAPYPYYERWADTFNTTTEFVVMDQARSLASLSFWMAQSGVKTQTWRSGAAHIVGLPSQTNAAQTVTATVQVDGMDTQNARVVWEARDQEPISGANFIFAAKYPGAQWVEVEVQWPDGRRAFAATNFTATSPLNGTGNNDESSALTLTSDMVGLYHLDGGLADASGNLPALALSGLAGLDSNNLGWMAAQSGASLRVNDLGDNATVSITGNTAYLGTQSSGVQLEGMIYVNAFKAYNRENVNLLSLYKGWNSMLRLSEDKYAGPFVGGGAQFSIYGTTLTSALTTKQWHHFSMLLDRNGYTVKIDGQVIGAQTSSDLANWDNGLPTVLEIGNFDGWIDEVVVKSFKSNASGGPLVSITSPTAGSDLAGPAKINLTASAIESGGTVAKVEYFQGTTKIGESAVAPYSLAWNNVLPGSYTLTARATDSAGVVSASPPISITVSQFAVAAPVISPAGGSFSVAPAVTVVTATANATIRYTLDGTTPSASSPAYTAPIVVFNTSTLKVKAFKAGLSDSGVSAADFSVTLLPVQAEVSFVATDTTTQGNWKDTFGADGHNVIGDSAVYPPYALVTPQGVSDYMWSDSTTDVRALQRSSGTGRLVECWYAAINFTVDLTDNLRHRVALYCLDWDRLGRSQTIELIDTDTGALLDSRTVTNFQEGKYLIWDIKGRVEIRFTKNIGPNALLMGMFFDPAPAQTPITLKAVGVKGGALQLRLSGESGKQYSIEASDDFKTWNQVGFQTLSSDSIDFTAPIDSGTAHRSYRAVLLSN